MAGRSTPGSLRSRSIDTAINAPVLPQETTTSASPSRTDSTADHIDVPLPVRITWLGLSDIATTPSAWRTSQWASRPLRLAMSDRSSSSGPWTTKRIAGVFFTAAAKPATTAAGPWSPPIASTERMPCAPSASDPERIVSDRAASGRVIAPLPGCRHALRDQAASSSKSMASAVTTSRSA